ncbi:MAG: type IV secretory system conjugative DNA transfer family protein [Lachnospiraceae bacterium]|nr:type IV secretory system conjugative DNA transfer family protein [Lachnospiraceae bacterium]
MVKPECLKGFVENTNKKTDMTPLADNYTFYADFGKTGVNQNVVVVASTGGGKTTSVVEPKLLHTFDTSMIVPLSKTALVEPYAELFEGRGYDVKVINFSDVKKSTIGYDPMMYVKNSDDVANLTKQLIDYNAPTSADPFWENNAESILRAIIELVMLNARSANKKPRFEDVINLAKVFRYQKPTKGDEAMTTTLDSYFKKAEEQYPDNAATEAFKTCQEHPEKTALNVYSTFKSAIDPILTDSVESLVNKRDLISFEELGKKKTVLFVVTSAFNDSLKRFTNIMYSQMFKALFDTAESNANKTLKVPVHVVCDDFACGTRIEGFEKYISIFRAAGISVTLLLQSESQLSSLYGEHAATTILNNADTYVFMGSMDDMTVASVSRRMNLPYDKVMQLPLEQVMVMRRGCHPYVGKRYQTYEDPIYKKMIAKRNRQQKG